MLLEIAFKLFLIVVFHCKLCHAFVEEAPDGSVCFNQCSGHGDCLDYSCHCWSGYLGDDCSTTFADQDNVVPILTSGHFNVTRKNITQTISKNKLLLVGFSAYSCNKCIVVEPEYKILSDQLKALKVPFARANADEMKAMASEFGANELPSLILFDKMKPMLYKGVHYADAVTTFVQKQLHPPAKPLRTVSEVTNFFASRNHSKYSVSTIMVVGFFPQHEDIEEDEYEDFMDIAKDLKSNSDIYIGVVTSAKVANAFKANKTIDRTPSLLLLDSSDQYHSINLNELFGDGVGPKEWIIKNSIPLVAKMTPQNFGLYEKLGIPILMMFLDLTDEMQSSNPGRLMGGRTGGILNELLVGEFKLAAKEHVDRIAFIYIDGTIYQDQMKSLGLYGGIERLPSLAFNTRDGSKVPFPEELPINRDTILQFCANFISGRLRSPEDSKEMARKALQSAVPINKKNQAVRQELKKAPEIQQGVSEQFGDGITGDHAVRKVTLQNFDEVVMNEDVDVVVLLHTKACERCSHFNVYFKRMAHRFKELAISSLVVAQMDITNETPPAHLNMVNGELPILLMVPANNKQPPFTYYSGVGKVQAMMKWVESFASIPFELPNLPHLSEKDRIAYKEQVREREEALDQKRREEKRAMEAEDRARAEMKRKKRKEEKLLQQQHQEQEEEEPTLSSALEDAEL